MLRFVARYAIYFFFPCISEFLPMFLAVLFTVIVILCLIRFPIPLGDHKSKLHATLCGPRFLIGSLCIKSSEKTQVVAQLQRKETEFYNCGYSAALLSKIEDILFEIMPCHRPFSICTFSLLISCNSTRLKFLSAAQTSP